MLADLQKYKGDYSLLALAAAFYLAVVVKFQTNPRYLLAATGAFAVFYILWGIFHHGRARSLTLRVVLEYFLVASLAVVIVSTLLI